MVNCELKMATRRSQRKRFQVKRLIAEVDSQPVAIERDRRNEMKVAKKDENLYEVKIIAVDAESRLIKVHFVGWDTRYDEWKADADDDDFPIGKYEKLQLPLPETKDERSAMFSQELYREVKRNLRPGHKGNPEVPFMGLTQKLEAQNLLLACRITENLTAILVNAGTEES